MTQTGTVLLISRDAPLAAALAQGLSGKALVRAYRELCDAQSALGRVRWSGIVVDLAGAPGALELIEALRRLAPLAPMLAMASSFEAALVNGAHALRVELIASPGELSRVLAFAERALSAQGLSAAHVQRWVRELIRLRELSAREADLFGYVLGAEDERAVMRRWGASEAAFDEQLRSMLRKCQARHIDALAKQVLLHARLFRDVGGSAARILFAQDEASDEEVPLARAQ